MCRKLRCMLFVNKLIGCPASLVTFVDVALEAHHKPIKLLGSKLVSILMNILAILYVVHNLQLLILYIVIVFLFCLRKSGDKLILS